MFHCWIQFDTFYPISQADRSVKAFKLLRKIVLFFRCVECLTETAGVRKRNHRHAEAPNTSRTAPPPTIDDAQKHMQNLPSLVSFPLGLSLNLFVEDDDGGGCPARRNFVPEREPFAGPFNWLMLALILFEGNCPVISLRRALKLRECGVCCACEGCVGFDGDGFWWSEVFG